MPALNFKIEWPNREVMEYYSPSTVLLNYFRTGDKLTVEELIKTSRTALDKASQRVEERFGYRCTAAAEQRDKILQKAACFDAEQTIQILEIRKHSG